MVCLFIAFCVCFPALSSEHMFLPQVRTGLLRPVLDLGGEAGGPDPSPPSKPVLIIIK